MPFIVLVSLDGGIFEEKIGGTINFHINPINNLIRDQDIPSQKKKKKRPTYSSR